MRDPVAAASLALFCILAVFVSSVSHAEPWTSWSVAPKSSSPLHGKVWSRSRGDFITPEELAQAVGEADMLLLGEYHDNADHHRLQAWLVQEFAKARAAAGKPKPPIVFEMIRQEQAQQLNNFLSRPNVRPEDLGAVIEWEKAGWPDWTIYLPIAHAAFEAGLKIVPGDASRDSLRDASRQNLKPLPQDMRKRLALEEPLDEPLQKALLDELFRGHCEMVAPALLSPMVDVQRFRDAVFARNMIDAANQAKSGSAILIAGNGHVRDDRGVPMYLAKQSSTPLKVVSIIMTETPDGRDDPQEIMNKRPDGQPAADFFWFTPSFDRGDPCQDFKKQMGRKPSG